MRELADEHANQLNRIKKNIEKSHDYWKGNSDRFNHFRNFVFDTALDPTTVALLKTLKKPQIEFNISEAYISRLRGEFAKQEPSIEVMAGDEQQVDPRVINVVQGHIKHILFDAKKNGFEYDAYTDMLSGGYAVAKVRTDYAHDMSFNQVILWESVYDPILTGFDPLARESHKGDGAYCFELYPKTKEDFEQEYPDVDISMIKYAREQTGFNWTYKSGKEDILILADYYEKKIKRVKIVQVTGGRVMKYDDYKKLIEEWPNLGLIEQPPAIMGKPRYTNMTTIVRYKLIGDKVLEHEETDYKFLPLVFFDGNSYLKREEITGAVQQMTRPYIYNAKGLQQLKNFAGQSLANELENIIQHKFKVAKEALPNEEDYLDAYSNVQQADVLVYNYLDPNRQDVTLPAPQEIVRAPIPPELAQTFMGADQMMQFILGNFDMDLGKMTQSQLSGVAIQESITQNNTAAMPFIVGFLQGLARMAEITIDLIPKYFVTPRTMPIVKPDGNKDYIRVNEQNNPQSPQMQYDENALNVHVSAGVNFSIQKSKNFQTIISLQQVSPLFQEFMATKGLKFLLRNVEMEGIDELQQEAEQWVQQKEQQMQQAQQMQMQQQQQMMMNNPAMLKVQAEAKKNQMDIMMKAEELKYRHADSLLRHDATIAKTKAEVEKAKIDAHHKEREHKLKSHDQLHKHMSEVAKMNHEHSQPQNEQRGNANG